MNTVPIAKTIITEGAHDTSRTIFQGRIAYYAMRIKHLIIPNVDLDLTGP